MKRDDMKQRRDAYALSKALDRMRKPELREHIESERKRYAELLDEKVDAECQRDDAEIALKTMRAQGVRERQQVQDLMVIGRRLERSICVHESARHELHEARLRANEMFGFDSMSATNECDRG